MKPIKLSEICRVLDIEFDFDNDLDIEHIANDINKINNNTVVFHIKKDVELNLNNYKNVNNCFVVTDQPILNNYNIDSHKFIFVLDVQKSYQQFINYYRNQFNLPVVAITGTCGKTTTKEIIKQILDKNYKVASTIGNKNHLGFNNDYLFSIESDTNYGVFETAISYPGNLIYGCEFFKPTIGVITNIGIDHLNGCKSHDNYIRTKGEMLAGLHYKGSLVINNDDENIKKIDFEPFKGTIITFGLTNKADFFADEIEYKDNGMEFTLNYKESHYKVFVPGLGNHNVYNSLAALTVLSLLGMDLTYCISQLASVKFIRSHLEVHNGFNKSTIIDDTWSSNPTSMKAALEVLKEKGKDKVKIVVLGKIAYLGDYADEQYDQIGKMIVNYGIDFLITTDSYSKKIAVSAINSGMKPDFHIHCKNNIELKSHLECLLDKNSIALFKTSMLEQSITGVIKQLVEDEL